MKLLRDCCSVVVACRSALQTQTRHSSLALDTGVQSGMTDAQRDDTVVDAMSTPLPPGCSELAQRLNCSVYLVLTMTDRNSFMSKMTATTCPVGRYQRIHLTVQDGN